MCWYDPPEESKKLIKHHCQEIVNEINRLKEKGDPYGCQLADVKELLDHLYNPSSCQESKSKN